MAGSAYGVKSGAIAELLCSEEAADFRASMLKVVHACFEVLERKAPPDCHTFKYDAYVVTVAIDSAFLDLKRAEAFHEFDGGPSADKIAAAMTYWVNRFHPLVINCHTRRHHWLISFHADLAIMAGLAICAGLSCSTPEEFQHYLESIPTEKLDALRYTLTWRDNSFRSLIPWFEFILR